MCGTLKEWDHIWLNDLQYLVINGPFVAHLAEQVGRPEDGSSREKAEAPAEVAAGAASVEVAADAESHKKAPAEVAGAASVEAAADASCRKVKTQRQ